MAPELKGLDRDGAQAVKPVRATRAADVFSFGKLLTELFSSNFKLPAAPEALVDLHVKTRTITELTRQCTQLKLANRPNSFDTIVTILEACNSGNGDSGG